jgi:S-DNA-T family DNA segregation ATPase FtsK/SpoIIIE
LREILEAKEFLTPSGRRSFSLFDKNKKSNLTIVLGKDVAGEPWVADLGKMPHLLVAGATGSGKTVCLNSIIISLLYQNSPDELKFILVDPKRVELPVYNGIPYLYTPVITEVPKIVNALKWAIIEMDRRFEKLSKLGARNIDVYNHKLSESSVKDSEEKMPYIVIIIDELADLMTAAGSEVEACIIRLAQMARAVGIHLIVATQRPSVDVITGLIKANITSRIAFAVASQTDSRTILDVAGAEKLLGRGDMLFISSELSKPKRLQGALVTDEEIKRVVEFIEDSYEEPEYDETVIERSAANVFYGGGNGVLGDDDPLLPEAKDTIMRAGKASASLLQRRLKIGYARAARLLDLLEEQGIIGPADGAKPREILVPLNTTSVSNTDDEVVEEESEGDDFNA